MTNGREKDEKKGRHLFTKCKRKRRRNKETKRALLVEGGGVGKESKQEKFFGR